MPIVLHRPIPDGFAVKTVRVTRKYSGWYVTLCLQIDVNIPDVMPHGRAMGIDVGLSVRIHECHECGSLKPRDVASGQVIKARGLSGIQQVGSISLGNPSIARLQIASGAEVSGVLEAISRQLAMKLESLKSDLEKPALYS